jgi:hypothetical protein
VLQDVLPAAAGAVAMEVAVQEVAAVLRVAAAVVPQGVDAALQVATVVPPVAGQLHPPRAHSGGRGTWRKIWRWDD